MKHGQKMGLGATCHTVTFLSWALAGAAAASATAIIMADNIERFHNECMIIPPDSANQKRPFHQAAIRRWPASRNRNARPHSLRPFGRIDVDVAPHRVANR